MLRLGHTIHGVYHIYKYTGQSLLLENEKIESRGYYDLCLAHNRYIRKAYEVGWDYIERSLNFG